MSEQEKRFGFASSDINAFDEKDDPTEDTANLPPVDNDPKEGAVEAETLPPEALPPVDDVEKDQEEPMTESVSTAAFLAVKHVRNLLDLLEAMPSPNDFNMEIDEISMFLGRTMQSLNQKLA